jgi:AraC family transcriptional regulator, regulatory protein of adaptative response / DNA-3-methyladenine glycosylase II
MQKNAPMDMDDEACYRAIEMRDRRFDGRLFVAVTTTGIYCRPFCPAPTPKRENVRFFQTAAAAQEAGFRPCLRCRPETAPELAPWRGESNTVARALRMIEAGALDTADVEALAMACVSCAACSSATSAHLRSRSLRPDVSFWPNS